MALGLLPAILAPSFPALSTRAAVAVWIVAPAAVVALLVVAAIRLRR